MESNPSKMIQENAVSKQKEERKQQFYLESQEIIYHQTDRMFSFLMIAQWLLGTIFGLVILPQYKTISSEVQADLLLMSLLVGIISVLPIYLGFVRPGKKFNRYVFTISQMAITSLLLDSTGNSSESHIYILGSIALLATYRDWKIPLFASAIVLIDHTVRHFFFPHFLFGDAHDETADWITYGGWLLLQNLFITAFILKSHKIMRLTASRSAAFYERENRFHSLMQNSDDIIYFTDNSGKFTMINPFMAETFGFTQEEATKYHYLDLIAPKHKTKVGRFYLRQLRKNISKTYFEFLAYTLDGREIWLSQKVRLLKKDGEVTGFQAIARDITARVKTEQALAKSENRIRTITDTAPDPIITFGSNGKITFASKSTKDMFGYEEEELIGQPLFKLISDKEKAQYQKALVNFLKTGERSFSWKGSEILAKHKNGQNFPIEISFGDHDSDGEKMFTAVVRDITERKKARAAIKRSKEYRNLFQHANDAIIIFEPDNEVILDVNDYACKMYGYSREKLIGRSLKDMSENPDADEKRSRLKKLLKAGIINSFETTHFHKNGKRLRILINASVIEFENRTAVLSINRDITARVKARKALTQSEYKLRTLIESMSEGLVQTDTKDFIIYVNKRFCEMTGYAREELIGQKASEMLVAESSLPIVENAIKRRLKGISDNYEVQLKTKSGNLIWCLIGAVPLLAGDGKVSSSMSVHTDISERKLAEQKLTHNAVHDALTGLPNRTLFLEHLGRAMKRSPLHKKTFAVLFLDFDGFKLINDSLGHMQGDILLGLIAERLKNVLRSFDIVARLGGDEFTILLDELTEKNDYLIAIERIEKEFSKPFLLSGNEVFIGASIGVAINRAEYKSPEEILRDADIAMYRAKSDRSVSHKVFNKEMHDQVSERLQLETDLRLAFERKEFEVFYQPIVNLVNERLIGFEALVRWNHPERGIVLPGEFIPIVEENGLIIPIGEWVLFESCRQLQEWKHSHDSIDDLTLSVNLSGKQFTQSNLTDNVNRILNQTKFEPNLLRLEITETHVMKNSENSIRIMNRLQEIGVRLSIDDFGTGYSSLSYLQRLPINFLKIDRSFVHSINSSRENSEIVRAIITLARNLHMDVIAEGIETRTEANKLIEFDCLFGQGYLYAHPADAFETEKLLKNQTNLTPPKNNDEIQLETIG